MIAIFHLWLPILLSAVVVFLLSSVVHMVLKWHASDYNGLANEDAVRAAIRAGSPAPGRYVVPFCKEMKDMGSEEMIAKYKEGPLAHLTIIPNGVPKMGKQLGLWFIWTLVVAAIAAFITTRVVRLDYHYSLHAAKVVAAITLIAHGFGTVTESIWMGRPWSSSVKYLLDAVLYAAGSGAVFFWLWG